jgi:hypothetical protein
MALILADRVRETSTTTGTGALSLAGAVVGYQTFSSAIGNTNTCYYAISNPGVAEWEVGIGTYATSGNTLTRTTILKSSNSNAAVSFSAGTKDVFVTYPATKSVYLDASGNVTLTGTLSATTSLAVGSGNSALKIDALGANNFEIYNGALTADGTNYAFAQNYTGANTQVNAASGGQVLLQIAGVTKATLTSTGLNSTAIGATTPSTGAFTTLSATGALTGTTGVFSGVVRVNGASADQILSVKAGAGGNIVSIFTSDYAVNTTGSVLLLGFLSPTGNTTARLYNGINGGAGAGGIQLGAGATDPITIPGTLAVTGTLAAGATTVTGTLSATGDAAIGQATSSFPSGGGMEIYNATAPRLKLTNSTTGTASTDGTHLLVSGSDFYIQQREAASVIIATNGSDRVTVDSSGNLGIGTSSPTRQLDVQTATSNKTVLNLLGNQSAWNSTGTLRIAGPSSGAVMSIAFSDGANSNGWFGYQDNATAANRFFFWSANDGSTQQMVLTQPGNLLVGTTSSAKGSSGSIISAGVAQENLRLNGSDVQTFVTFNLSGTTVGSITAAGSVTSYNVTSDQRLKENIQDADSASALIDALQVRQYDWKEEGSHQRYGFVAQELVIVAPEAVHQPEDSEQMMAVDYSKLVPMLVKEIQSLRQRLSAANL